MKEVVIQEKALELINEACCYELPIDVKCIATQKQYQIKIFSESKNLLSRLNVEQFTQKFKSFNVNYKGIYYIFVSDNITLDLENHLIAHEIGHIVLGHDKQYDGFDYPAELEQEANQFALCLIAPIPLLANTNVSSVKKVRKITKLSVSDSEKVFNKIVNYRMNNCGIGKQTKIASAFFKFGMLSRLFKHRFKLLYVSCFLVIFSLVMNLTITRGNKIEKRREITSNITSSVSVVYEKHPEQTNSIVSVYYWTSTGKVYHTHRDCQSLKNAVEINSGNLDEASKEKERLCKFCQAKDSKK